MEDIRNTYQGRNLRAKRLDRLMTQPELAEKPGVSVTTVNHFGRSGCLENCE
jgi:DNA-binding XRE family transcriptional regulator